MPDLPFPQPAPTEPLQLRQLAFGWSEEDLRLLVAPLAATGKEPNGSMGNDIPLAVPPQLLDRYVGEYAAPSGLAATFRSDGETLLGRS